MNDRIRELREVLHLSQEALGTRVGVTRGAISRIENGTNSVTSAMVLSLCREFNVNEDWLRTGKGDMFNPMSEDEELDLYIGRISGGSDNFKKKFIKKICMLTEDEWDVLKKIISETKEC